MIFSRVAVFSNADSFHTISFFHFATPFGYDRVGFNFIYFILFIYLFFFGGGGYFSRQIIGSLSNHHHNREDMTGSKVNISVQVRPKNQAF